MAKMNQIGRMLRHMNDYGSITSLEAMTEYGIMRAPSRIYDIRQLGYSEPMRYARYTLEGRTAQ